MTGEDGGVPGAFLEGFASNVTEPDRTSDRFQGAAIGWFDRAYDGGTSSIATIVMATTLVDEVHATWFQENAAEWAPSQWTYVEPQFGHEDEFAAGYEVGGWTFRAQEVATVLWKAGDTATYLSVVRPLLKFVSGLNDYAKRTGTVSKRAAAVRQALSEARQPDSLLFTDLPKACGLKPFKIGSSGELVGEREVIVAQA